MRMMDELGAAAAASASNSTPSSSSSSSLPIPSSDDSAISYFSLFQNYPLISAVVGFAIAQSIKFFTTWAFVNLVGEDAGSFHMVLAGIFVYKEKRWDVKQLVASGGMPSSHSSTVTALAIAIGCQDGFGASTFAVAMILACVVMYDAVGVRLHAGKQAEVLNQIVYELPAEHPLAETRPLRELLGHTPFQVVAGSLLGVVIAVIGYLINHL